MSSILQAFAGILHFITTTNVHPTFFPFALFPTIHAARVSVAYQANARKSPGTLTWGTYIAGYLIMCWGGGLLSNFMLGLPPPMLYSFAPWINYLTVHFVLTTTFSLFPSLLHPPTLDTMLFPIDAAVRAAAVTGTLSLLSPSSSTYQQINPLYTNSPLSYMIIGALASSGGGILASTLGTWSEVWVLSTPPFLKAGLWGSLDVWGGALIAMVYGIATNHPAFIGFVPTILNLPIISNIAQVAFPNINSLIRKNLSSVEARALSAFILSSLFGLRVYNTHFIGATEVKVVGSKTKSTTNTNTNTSANTNANTNTDTKINDNFNTSISSPTKKKSAKKSTVKV